MRFVCPSVAVLLALTFLAPSGLMAQNGAEGLSIVNYKFVSEQRLTRTESYVTYRADLENKGVARPGVVATLTSLVPTVKLVPDQSRLHFGPSPSNSQVTSTNTFTILVDRSVPFDFANLKWSFLNPVAIPGPAQTAPVGSTITLNGSASTNPSGVGTLTYQWAFASRPAGSTAALVNPNNVTSTFVIDAPGTYVINLTVNNGVAQDTRSVTVSTVNSLPVANAGSNQTVTVGNTVNLNGSASSDVDGDPLTYSWAFVSVPQGSAAVIGNPQNVTSSFVADVAGTYIVRLIVNDGKGDSQPSTVTITAGAAANTPPVANAGPNQTGISVGATVQLNGSGSTDVNGDPLTYKWTLITRPNSSNAQLSNSNAVNPTFVADVAGTYVAQLIVNDGKIDSDPATVTITTTTPIGAPTANAGANQTVAHGTTVTLNGSGTDPQNLPLTFQWSFTSRPQGSAATLSSTTAQQPTFVADRPGQYVLQLIVNNGTLNSPPATVTITTTNTAPVANPGANQTVTVGSVVSLNGGGSTDADNDPLTYAWTFTSRPNGSAAALSAANSATPTFVADVAGPYVVQLIVNDGFAASEPKTVTITAIGALAITTTALTPGSAGAPYSFQVEAAGGTAPYAWSATGLPANLTINTTTGQITGTPTAAGTSTVNVTVMDAGNPQLSATKTFSLAINQGTPASIEVSSGSGQSATISTAFANPLRALVKDANGNPLSGITVTFAVPGTGASATFANGNTAVTDANGIATSPVLTANATAGSYNVAASAGANVTTNFALTNNVGAPASIAVSSGSPQSATLNAPFGLPLQAVVKDAGGNPVPNVSVTFAAPASGASGTFAGGVTTATTDANGIATSAVFSANGTQGPYNVSASVTANPALTTNFALTNTVGTPAAIEVSAGSGQSTKVTTAFANPLRALVKDSNGNPLAGITVTFSVPASGASGTFAGGVNTAVTDASGIATSAVFTANGTIGEYAVVATAAAGVTTSFTLTNTVGDPATIAVSSGSPQNGETGAAFPELLKAVVKDAGGNPVPNVSVTFTAPASGPSGTFAGGVTTATTDANGIATAPAFTANTTLGGPYNVVATVTGNANITGANFALTNVVGPPKTITVLSGNNQSAQINAAFANTVSVEVKDASGNVLPNITVTFLAPGTGASAAFANGQNTAVTNSSGVATSAVLTANATAGPYTITAQAAPSVSTTVSLTNTPGPAAAITAVSGTPQQTPVTSPFGAPLRVQVKDAGGNGVPNVVVTFTPPAATGASGTFAGGVNTATTDAEGFAQSPVFTANNISGSYNVVASVNGHSVNFALTNTPGVPTTITVVDGSSQTVAAGSAFANPLRAVVKDQHGNLVSGATVTFTAVAGQTGATGTFANGQASTTAVTDANGVATSSALTANNTGGNFIVNAAVPGVATPASFLLTNTSTQVASLTVVNGTSPQSTIISTLFPSVLQVQAKDANGAVVPGANIQFTVTPAVDTGAAGTFLNNVSTATTDAQGIASSQPFSANNKAGTFSVRATVVNNAGIFADFVMTNTPGAPCCVVMVSGSGQTVTTNTNFPQSLQARVTDSGGNPLRTVQVTFTAPAVGPSGTFSNGTNTFVTSTDSAGLAVATFRSNGTQGSYVVSASIAGGAKADFALTNQGGGVGSGIIEIAGVTPGQPAATIGKNLQDTITISLSPGAPAGLPLTIRSLDPTKALVGNAVPSLTLNLIEGTTSVGTTIQSLADSGQVMIEISAPNYNSAIALINLAPSGFVLVSPTGIGSTFDAFQGTTTALQVQSMRLNANGTFAQTQQLRVGFSNPTDNTSGPFTVRVPVSVGNSSLGNVSPTLVTIVGGNNSANVNFTASSSNSGPTSISLNNAGATVVCSAAYLNDGKTCPAAGFTAPLTGSQVTANVKGSDFIPFTATVGKNLQKAVSVSLTGPAASLIPVTITSSDPSKVLFATNLTNPGTASITVNIPVNQPKTQDFFVRALADSGEVAYTITSPGRADSGGVVTLGKSGFLIESPGGFGASSFSVPAGIGDPNITVYVGLITGNIVTETQFVNPGITIPVTVQSSNTGVGTITTSPIEIVGGSPNPSASTKFHPVTPGSTTITASSPDYTSAQVAVTVTQLSPPLVCPETDLGFGLQTPCFVTLPTPAGNGGTPVQVTSNAPSMLALSETETGQSLSTITVNVPAGQTTATFWLRGLSDSGEATFTASANGFGSRIGRVFFASSSLLLIPSTFMPTMNGTVNGSGSASLLSFAVSPDGSVIQAQGLIGGVIPSTSLVSSSNPAVATAEPAAFPESQHPYPLNVTTDWTWASFSASSHEVTFDEQTSLGPGDQLFILNSSGNHIPGSPFTGNSLAGMTVTIPGGNFTIRLVSDATGNGYGFKVTNIVSRGGSVQNVTVPFKAVGNTTLTVNQPAGFIPPQNFGVVTVNVNP